MVELCEHTHLVAHAPLRLHSQGQTEGEGEGEGNGLGFGCGFGLGFGSRRCAMTRASTTTP